jgi:NADH-quinone oxidoreductase subunit N
MTGDLLTIEPLLIVAFTAVAVLISDALTPSRRYAPIAVALAGLGLTSWVLLQQSGQTVTALSGAYIGGPFVAYLGLIGAAVVAITLLISPDHLAARRYPSAEFATTLLFALCGAILVGAASDLVTLFIGLELLVIPGYLLAGYAKRDPLSTEGAVKYFLLGSFSSAILLFGIVLLWGSTGTASLTGIATALSSAIGGGHPAVAVALALITTGVAFKIAAVPFHYWTPDAYQGSPTPITGYLSVGPKIGAFVLMIKLFLIALLPLASMWIPVVALLAAATMTLGNLVALTQGNVKRMLAYSSIAHTGYLMVGIVAAGAGQSSGVAGVLFYSAAYALMNLGAFAFLTAVQGRPGSTVQLSDLAGLGRKHPHLALLATLFLLSLTGIPPTAGFFAKAYVILSAVQAGGVASALAIVAVLNAAIAAFYYLRVIVYLFMRDPAEAEVEVATAPLLRAGLLIAAVGTLLLGLLPSGLIEAVVKAIAS